MPEAPFAGCAAGSRPDQNLPFKPSPPGPASTSSATGPVLVAATFGATRRSTAPPAASTPPVTNPAVETLPCDRASFRIAPTRGVHSSFLSHPFALLSSFFTSASAPNTAPTARPAAPTPSAATPSGFCHGVAGGGGAGGVSLLGPCR